MKFHSGMWAYSPQEEVDAKGLARAVMDWANWARSCEDCPLNLPEAGDMEAAAASIIDTLGGWTAVNIIELMLYSLDDEQRMSIAEQLRPEILKIIERELDK